MPDSTESKDRDSEINEIAMKIAKLAEEEKCTVVEARVAFRKAEEIVFASRFTV